MADMRMVVNTALSEVPVNLMPLIDDTDFKSRETAIAYNASGMDLVWNFVTTGGAFTQTAVTPTSGGDYDWAHQGDGMYTIEIPASGGASVNNDSSGYGWFSGFATGVLPWRGPIIEFTSSNVCNALTNATVTLWTNVTELAGNAQSATDLRDFADTGYDPATHKVEGLKLADLLTAVAGTIQTLDQLDTAQDIQHGATQTIANSIIPDVLAIKTRTDRIPNVAAGASGGILIAGSNAATTFATPLAVNAIQISGDSTAADKLEGYIDNDSFPANLVEIQSSAIIETSAENIASNFSSFFDNNDDVSGVPILNDIGSGGGGAALVDADVVTDSRTWFATSNRARNIISVNGPFEGTFALKPDINPNTTIDSVDSVTITGPATVTATDLKVNRAFTRAHFSVPPLTTPGTYTVAVTVTTIDSQAITTTGTLKVY
jgi:hypothetical protein